MPAAVRTFLGKFLKFRPYIRAKFSEISIRPCHLYSGVLLFWPPPSSTTMNTVFGIRHFHRAASTNGRPDDGAPVVKVTEDTKTFRPVGQYSG
jgi:hypothetical protein